LRLAAAKKKSRRSFIQHPSFLIPPSFSRRWQFIEDFLDDLSLVMLARQMSIKNPGLTYAHMDYPLLTLIVTWPPAGRRWI
jgi:hypothetical protein